MITQKITGGLGNQMFQYAFIKALSLKQKSDFKIDISSFSQYKLHKYCLEVFSIKNTYATKKDIPFYENLSFKNKLINKILIVFKGICKKINTLHYTETQFNFNKDTLSINSGYVEGYFQTEKYFLDYKKEIQKDFEFIIPPTQKNGEYKTLIQSCNSTSLHIRRGDYVSNSLHETTHLDYYKKAIQLIEKKVDNPIFFFFSDDIEWVKSNLQVEYTSHYIDWNDADTNYEDMRLMSLCKHNIIANSSFSWWGAWLNKNKNKIVVAPKKWFNSTNINYSDVIPKNWIKI